MDSEKNLRKLFATETQNAKKTFRVACEHEDGCNGGYPTNVVCSDSDFGFTGVVQGVRLRYKSKANYASGFAVFHTYGLRGGYDANGKKFETPQECELAAVLPLSVFANFFCSGKELADGLEARGKALIAAWAADNKGVAKKSRFHVNKTYELASWNWTEGRRRESSAYTLQLNSFGFTVDTKELDVEEPTLDEIKVLIKLKSTKNASGPDESSLDEEGRAYDRAGYCAPLSHFLNLLRSEDYALLCQKVLARGAGSAKKGGHARSSGERIARRLLDADTDEDLAAHRAE